MIKALYKPLALVLGLVAGILAGRIVAIVWQRVGGDGTGVPPEPDQKQTSWGPVLAGAALQGTVYAIVKAAVKRGGAQGVEKVTGSWPGKRAGEAKKSKVAQ